MSNKTTRISSDELSAFAAQGIERALQAREFAGVELSREQLDQVSGGLNIQGIIAGGRRLQASLGLSGAQTNPLGGGLATSLGAVTFGF